eukprot:Em0018g935a
MSYYHGLISSKKASTLLENEGDGYFIIRDSQSQPGCFVISANSAGHIYHILVYNRDGRYILDTSEEGDSPHAFDSLDDLVTYCTTHELRVEGDELQLHHVLPCEIGQPQSQPKSHHRFQQITRHEDSDTLTDLLAPLFGSHCTVIALAHSHLHFNGQPLPEGVEYLSVLMKDSQQKGYYIRLVDTKDRKVVGEKRITKVFEYDTPSELVITYLSEHGITCVGFHDIAERQRFIFHLDRVMKLQQDKALRLRARVDSETRQPQKPTELTNKLKAADFDINHLSLEWQYLFDMAGVTKDMLQNPGTLQFILDTIYKIGGAPKKLTQLQDEIRGPHVTSNKEREVAIAVDHTLRRESLKASRLADELKKESLLQDPPGHQTPAHSCPVLTQCELFKDHLMDKHSLFAIGPCLATCYCSHCSAGKTVVAPSGTPPRPYNLPVGWCQFTLRSHAHKLARNFCSEWHTAYCSVPCSQVAGMIRTGQLLRSHEKGGVLLSPDIEYAVKTAGVESENYYDDVTVKTYKVNTAFKVLIQPESYRVHVESTKDTHSPLCCLVQWIAPERTYVMQALLVQLL